MRPLITTFPRRRNLCFNFVLFFHLSVVFAWGQPTLAPVFTDHMVLQQNAEIRIWGDADPDEKITVNLDHLSATTNAQKDGHWSVTLSPLIAGGPFDLQVAGKTSIIVHDILIGELWIASGQSNMAFPLRLSVNGEGEQKSANFPNIRLLKLSDETSGQSPWVLCSPDTAGTFSAVAYFFARNIHQSLHVPVGIILGAYRGSKIEQWSAPQALAKIAPQPSATSGDAVETPSGQGPAARFPASYFYETMIKPLFPLQARGVLWYQGESNVNRAYQYRALLSAMIDSWRGGFHNQNLQFLIVQLPGFGLPTPQPRDTDWPQLREAQALVTKTTSDTGLAVTIDVGDVKLHPPRKREVGERLSALAKGLTYKLPGVFSGPVYTSAQIDGDKIIVHLDASMSALAVQGSGPLLGFTLADANHRFHWANASIQGDTVVVSSPDVSAPVAVRYAWANNPACNLFNQAGFPAAPFRSDDWPGPIQPKRPAQ